LRKASARLTFKYFAALAVLFVCFQTPVAWGEDGGHGAGRTFWMLVFYGGVAALLLFAVSLGYVVWVRRRNARRMQAARQQEEVHEAALFETRQPNNPGNPGGSPEFSAVKTVDPQTGRVIYDMQPVSGRPTEVGTFAYVLMVGGILAAIPVYGLPAALAVLVLAPVAARRFQPSLERVVGYRLIMFATVAAGLGALVSVLSSRMYLRGSLPAPAGSQAAGFSPADVPVQVPLVLIVVLIFSVVMHESAHGLTAYWCGDPTAKKLGRLSLNPLRHVDLFGTFILPVMLFLLTRFAIGYAKPVPINASHFGRRRRDEIIASTAGATANFMLGTFALAGLVAVAFFLSLAWPGARVSGFSSFLQYPVMENVPLPWLWSLLTQMLKSVVVVNLVLGAFNLLPIPPLDGSYVLENLLPRKARFYFRFLRVFGFAILIVLLFTGVLGGLFEPILRLIMKTSDLIHFVSHLH